MKLIFATNNQHKIHEIKYALPKSFEVITLKEAGINIEISEPFNTLKKNAWEKARIIHRLTNTDCFSEDTGLEVFALKGAPGVKTARYGGENASPRDNIEKLLYNLTNISKRSAQFKTIICLIMQKRELFFEGICTGTITTKQMGTAGFGYDPVFIPDGAQTTFAQMSLKEKNRYSHRKKALDKLVAFLKQ
jgi:XTP/dITP diphosphohydrolase